jgi:hypothetical protein
VLARDERPGGLCEVAAGLAFSQRCGQASGQFSRDRANPQVGAASTLAADVVVVHVAQELATSFETNSGWPVSGHLANGQVSSMNSGQTGGDLTAWRLPISPVPVMLSPVAAVTRARRAGKATARATPPGPGPRARIGHIPNRAGIREEATMARRLYYRDSYGRVQRARAAEHGRGLPAAPVAKLLMILAIIVVLASLVH